MTHSRGTQSWPAAGAGLLDRGGRATPEQVAHALRTGHPTDRAFDRFLPDDLQVVSDQYWTPLCVVQQAVRWLDDLGVRTVLDIGSGAGKFCVAAALAGRCRFVGLEQRPRLVQAARALAELFDVEDRVRFIEGALGETEIPSVDAYYLFNPFGENVFDADNRMDQTVELSISRYESDVARVENLLQRAPVGTCLLTYNGFGGVVPRDFQEVRADRELPNVLRMWRKLIAPSMR